MTEYQIGYIAVGGIIGLALGCLFYMIGGRSGKWVRRFIGSLIIALTVNLEAYLLGGWHWALTLVYPALILGFCQGYGADSTKAKIMRRAIYALTVMSAGVVCACVFGGAAWLIFVLHLCIGIWSIWLGVLNPVQAAAEETFICLLLNAALIMYPFTV